MGREELTAGDVCSIAAGGMWCWGAHGRSLPVSGPDGHLWGCIPLPWGYSHRWGSQTTLPPPGSSGVPCLIAASSSCPGGVWLTQQS